MHCVDISYLPWAAWYILIYAMSYQIDMLLFLFTWFMLHRLGFGVFRGRLQYQAGPVPKTGQGHVWHVGRGVSCELCSWVFISQWWPPIIAWLKLSLSKSLTDPNQFCWYTASASLYTLKPCSRFTVIGCFSFWQLFILWSSDRHLY